MSLENRVEKLEQKARVGKEQVTLFVVEDGQPQPTGAQKEAAIEAYKAKNPDWEGKDIMVIEVVSELDSFR